MLFLNSSLRKYQHYIMLKLLRFGVVYKWRHNFEGEVVKLWQLVTSGAGGFAYLVSQWWRYRTTPYCLYLCQKINDNMAVTYIFTEYTLEMFLYCIITMIRKSFLSCHIWISPSADAVNVTISALRKLPDRGLYVVPSGQRFLATSPQIGPPCFQPLRPCYKNTN